MAASICAALGRDAIGTGGGATVDGSAGVPPAVFPDTSGMVRTNLAGAGGNLRSGSAGAGSSTSSMPGDHTGLLGTLVGSDGRASPFRAGRAGIDRWGMSGGFVILTVVVALATSFSLACAASRSRRVGGSGGNFADSSGGGSFRLSANPGLVADEAVLFNDREEMVERCDLTDSLEVRRAMTSDWVDGLLGGRAGDGCGCSVSLLCKEGARARAGGDEWPTSFSVWLLDGRAGGALLTGREGIVGVALCEPCVSAGAREAGRFGGGGGGGLLEGVVKFFCWFRAAILSAKELKRGSSASAMVAK